VKLVLGGIPRQNLITAVEGHYPVLQGRGFYQKVTLQELNTLVDYLTSLKGDAKTDSGSHP